MASETFDTVALVQRLVELIDTGRRVSTYKLATLMALIDVCVEHRPADDGTLAVPVQELAHRIVAYYWPQVRPYGERIVLSQNHSAGRSIPMLVAEFRTSARFATAESAREAGNPNYIKLIRSVELVVAQQPLTHFHTIAGQNHASHDEDFMFDAGGFHKKMTRKDLDARGQVVLRRGVADALRETSVLLRSFVKNAWTADVIRLNKTALDSDDIDGFLFGASREALTKVTEPLRDLQNNRCFYCENLMPVSVHIDHVLPWSRIPIDGVANLVATDASCNLAKSASIPIRSHVDRALQRTQSDLEEISYKTRLPLLRSRTRSASIGVYSSLPAGVPLWVRAHEYEPFVPE